MFYLFFLINKNKNGECLNIDVLSNADNLRLPIILPGATSLSLPKKETLWILLSKQHKLNSVLNQIPRYPRASTLQNTVFIQTFIRCKFSKDIHTVVFGLWSEGGMDVEECLTLAFYRATHLSWIQRPCLFAVC